MTVTVTLPDDGTDKYMRFGEYTSSTTTAGSTSTGAAPSRHTATPPASGPTWKATKRGSRGVVAGADRAAGRSGRRLSWRSV